MVGLICILTDGDTIAYIQDFWVKPGFRGNDIGDELMSHMLEKLDGIRQIVLTTDAGEARLSPVLRFSAIQSLQQHWNCHFQLMNPDNQLVILSGNTFNLCLLTFL